MKNRPDLKKCIIQIIIIVILCTTITTTFNVYKYKRYTKNYNYKINNLTNSILNKYPDISKNEIIELLNDNTNDTKFLTQYGIDIKKNSIITTNDQLLKEYLIIDISIIITTSLLIAHLFLKYNNKKNKEINDITKLITKINNKNYKIDIDSNSEEELSILKNEIYKTTIMLNEEAANASNDKINLKKSLSDISHQLKTPLTSILITIDNIIDNPEMDKTTREKFILKIKREIKSMNFLVQNILKLSKLEANTIKFINEKNLVDKIITESIDNVSSLCDLKNITIKYKKNNIKINCDLKWQIEAITNILKNCVEYSNNNSNIDINVKENTMYIEIEIKDYGTGIDNEDLKHIFDRFYKGKNSTSDSVGIGLALAKTIIEQNNGIISVYSKKQKGTTFKIKYYI